MKNTNRLILLGGLLLSSINYGFAQNGAVSLGSIESFSEGIKKQVSTQKNQRTGQLSLMQKVSEKEQFSLDINTKKVAAGNQYLAGAVKGHTSGSFFIHVDGNKLNGNIILKKEKKAYKYFSDEKGNAYIENVDIDKVLCIDYTSQAANASADAPVAQQISAVVADLQSYPGARGCILLDFDGQYVAGTPWNNGNPINAAPSGMSDDAIREAWELISEDYRPFNVNITTNEAVFNSYPRNMRMRCIFTPTNTAAPGAGGVAYISSFRWDDDTPCWVFILSGKAGGEAASHEIGHCFGLGHDGRISPSEGYFAGHGDWAPIMGVGYYKNVSQWSRGEYNSANNKEDDLAKISSAEMAVGYRNDNAGNSMAAAANLSVDGSGNVNHSGIIERNNDLDYFAFNSGNGTISLNVNTVYRHGDLDIQVKLFNASGALIGVYNPAGLNASFSATVGQGKYYIEIDGVGAGNPATDGYSDYSSLGSYFITGKIPVPVNNNNTSGIATFYRDCNFSGTAVGLEAGDYTLAQLNSRGILNDDISSLRVGGGYEVVLYENDNFSGASVVISSAFGCLVDNGWNDRASSLRIRTNGVTNLAGVFTLQNRHSGLYADIAGISTANGAKLIQWNYTGATNQQFEFVHLGGGVYRVTAKHSGRVLDIADNSMANGAALQQWDNFNAANQQFIVKTTGDGFYKLYAKSSNKIVEVNNFSTTPGEKVQQWDDANQATGQWKLVPVSPSYSTLIQAENYSAMNGVQTESTTDAGGGLNVGWIDANDWMAYNSINFPVSGNYLIEYRVASVSGGKLSSDLNGGSIVLGAVNVPATGGWQSWTTVSQTVYINAGTYNFGVFAATGGWNLNWIKITLKPAGAAIATEEVVTSVQNIMNGEVLRLFPNPATETLFVQGAKMSEGVIVIMDNLGRQVMELNAGQETIDVSSLSPGMYSLILKNNSGITSQRFIKK